MFLGSLTNTGIFGEILKNGLNQKEVESTLNEKVKNLPAAKSMTQEQEQGFNDPLVKQLQAALDSGDIGARTWVSGGTH